MPESVHVLLVGGAPAAWGEVLAWLTEAGYAVERIELAEEPAEVAAQANRRAAVVFVDLCTDLFRGIETIAACRRVAPAVPVVAVAENPSVDLARSIRASGVFYLAVHPVTVEETRTVIEDALRASGRNRPTVSTCRTKKRVLIVDDDADFRASVQALLEAEGCAVSCAACARDGLERLEIERPDLIVLDVMMEDEWAGYAMNQAVKFGDKQAIAGEIPILMVSSIQSPPQACFPTSAEAGMVTPDLYMTKPLDIPVFLGHVRRLLGRTGGGR